MNKELWARLSAVRQVVPLFLRPGANLRVLQALRGVAGVATAAGRTHLAASLNVGLNGLGEFLEMLAVQINFVRRAIEGEANGLIGGGAIFFVFFMYSFLSKYLDSLMSSDAYCIAIRVTQFKQFRSFDHSF